MQYSATKESIMHRPDFFSAVARLRVRDPLAGSAGVVANASSMLTGAVQDAGFKGIG